MTYKESVIRGRIHSEHIVQLFDSAESLADSVAEMLTGAYAKGDGLLVVARQRNWNAISVRLTERGKDVQRLRRSGHLTVLDAAETLNAISRGDMPAADLFDTVIAARVRRLAADRPLAIYGEMVELLAEEGDFASALALEDMWNGLSEQCSFHLLCGYSAAHFAAPGQERALRRVCAAHSRVNATSGDPLAAWLVRLTRAPLKLVQSRG